MLISPPPSETGKTVGKPGCPRSSILPTQPPTGLSRHLPSAEPSLTQSLHSWAWVSRGSSFFVIWFSVLLWGTPGDGETTSLQSRKLLQPSHFQIQTLLLQPGSFLHPPSYSSRLISNSMSCSHFPFLLFLLLFLLFKA